VVLTLEKQFFLLSADSDLILSVRFYFIQEVHICPEQRYYVDLPTQCHMLRIARQVTIKLARASTVTVKLPKVPLSRSAKTWQNSRAARASDSWLVTAPLDTALRRPEHQSD
jgi:hypothetical protein